MNTFRLEAIKKEFPFVQEAILMRGDGIARNTATLENISIKRVNSELLNSTPKEYTWNGSCVGIDEWEKVHFVLDNGAIIRDAVRKNETHGSNYAHSETHTSFGETILEAIYRLGVADKVTHIVRVYGGHNVVEHFSEPDWGAVIFKASKTTTIADEISKAVESASAEVSAEVTC